MPKGRYKLEWDLTIPLLTLEDMIGDAARAAGVSPAQVAAVCYIESRGNPRAVNPRDPSYGLMQLILPVSRPAWAPALAYADSGDVVNEQTLIQNPALNLKLGARFLAHLSKKYSAKLAFAEWVQAYNLGETKFDRGVRNYSYRGLVWDSEAGKRVYLTPGELAGLMAKGF